MRNKRLLVVGFILFSIVAIYSLSTNSASSNSKAINIVKKVCDGSNKLSWQKRADLAAQAARLNSIWIRLADAANVQAGVADLSRTTSRWAEAPGNDGVAIALNQSTLYAQFTAECSTLSLYEKNN